MNKTHYQFDELSFPAQLKAKELDPRKNSPEYQMREALENHFIERIHSEFPSTPPYVYYSINTPDGTDYLTYSAYFDLQSLLPGGQWESLIGEPVIKDLVVYPELNRLEAEDSATRTVHIWVQTDVNEELDPSRMTVTVTDDAGRIKANHEEILNLEALVLQSLRAYSQRLIKYAQLQLNGAHIQDESLEEWYRNHHTLFTRDGTPASLHGLPLRHAGQAGTLIGEVAVGRQHSSSESGGWDVIEVRVLSSALEGLSELQVAAAFEKAAADVLEARGEPCVFLKLLSYSAENGI